MITLTAQVVGRVVEHARRAAPSECCGLLLGDGANVAEAVPIRNISESPARFLIDPAEHIAERRRARVRGLSVMGFYHSHPHSAPLPSASDRDEATYPDHLYLIVSLAADPPELGLFQFVGGNFERLPFVTVG